MNRELVRDQDSVARNNNGFGVEFAPEGARHFDRLQTAPKGLGEGTVYRPLKTSFEVIQKAQESPRCSGLVPF